MSCKRSHSSSHLKLKIMPSCRRSMTRSLTGRASSSTRCCSCGCLVLSYHLQYRYCKVVRVMRILLSVAMFAVWLLSCCSISLKRLCCCNRVLKFISKTRRTSNHRYISSYTTSTSRSEWITRRKRSYHYITKRIQEFTFQEMKTDIH